MSTTKSSFLLKEIPLYFLLLFLVCFSTQEIHAQINPPDFICVDNDTLKWDMPTNNCGAFISYDIYFSDNINGPYSILATVTDANTNSHFHINANSASNLWYYYIESNFDCPGELPLQSDTLDNRDVDFPPIDVVTVSGNDIEIFWTMSQAPETAGYIIYQETDNGNYNPIDTVYPETTTYYLDTNVDPALASEKYTIQAIDGCGNTSIFNTEPQSSILLGVEINACTQAANLSWDLYENWSEGIDNQEIWVSINGDAPVLSGTVSATATSFSYENLDDGNEYCFILRANRNNSTFFSESNEICLVASIIQPNRNLSLQSVSFTPDDEIELIWRWDTNSEINNVMINTSDNNSNYSNLNSFPPDFPLTTTDTTYIPNHSANDGKQYFQIVTRDDCDSTSTSNYGATIFLTGQSNPDFTNSLQWTAFDIENGSLIEYRLYKKTLVNEFPIAVLDSAELDFLDIVDVDDIYDANACYFVAGYAIIFLPDGTVSYTLSRSNTICLEQFASIQFPNAFAPNGKNTIFKPRIAFPNLIASYELQVFDRWGKMLYTGNDYDEGWNGNFKGKRAKSGAYVYRMKLIQTDGKIEERNGTVVLLR